TDHTYHHVLANRDPVTYYIFQYTLDGYGEFIHKGKKNMVQSGTAFLIKSPSPSIYQQHPDYDSYSFVFYTMRGDAAMTILDQIVARHGNIIKIHKNSACIQMLCQHIIALHATAVAIDPYEESLFAYKFVLALLREHTSRSSKASEKIPESIERAIDYMEMHLSNPMLDVSDMAKEAKISRCYFTRLFKKIYGTSPRKYLLSRRLNAAMQMLLNDRECHLKEVIDQCGFTSETYFCYAFRKMYNCSPGTCRKLHI
ncbi:MAG: AraC family transcriptional regulator, partial [Lentisphaeria bacterium]|nr:AraC family transcriptional regulator [Lentisphaeria bacterium]